MARYFRYSPRGFSNEINVYEIPDEKADEWAYDFEAALGDFDAERFDEIEEPEARRLMRAKWNRYGAIERIR